MKDDIEKLKALTACSYLIKATSVFKYNRRVALSLYVSCKINL